MTSLSDLPIRDNLKGLQPYGAPEDVVPIRLNVNENTHALPESIVNDIAASIAEAARSVNRYPEREFPELREALARYVGHGVDSSMVWAANGSNEVLQQILQAFGGPGRSLLSFTPTYSMYPILSAGTDTTWIPVERPPGYELAPEFVRDAIEAHAPNITILCGPNNPTGTRLTTDTIRAAYEASDGILIVDEAYFEFDEQTPSAIELLRDRPRLLVSRTMSKAFAFAGVRVGYLVADPAVIDALRLVRLPYHLSALTQAAAVAALRHAETLLATVADIRGQRDRLGFALRALGYAPHDSGANFLLVDGFEHPSATFSALRAQGILIRDPGIPGHLRFTAGTEGETTAVIEAIAALSASDR